MSLTNKEEAHTVAAGVTLWSNSVWIKTIIPINPEHIYYPEQMRSCSCFQSCSDKVAWLWFKKGFPVKTSKENSRITYINFSLLSLKLLIYVPQRQRCSHWTLARFPFHTTEWPAQLIILHGKWAALKHSSIKAFYFASISMYYAVSSLVKKPF